ncbi:MAG: hypothetical protein PWQ08_1197 [Clostridiales bacterium]|nr:hypothetical protein [Clostridiales bacterium]
MTSLSKIPAYNKEPWEIPLSARVRAVSKAFADGKKVALLCYRAADNSTFRYRCYNVMQASQKSKEWGAVYFFQNEIEQLKVLLPQASLLVFTRVGWSIELESLAIFAKQKKVPVLFDVDDYVFNIDIVKLLANTLAVDLEIEENCNYWFSYIGRIQKMASMAQGFITTNEYLGKKLQKKFGKEYCIIPNSLNEEQLVVSAMLAKQKAAQFSAKPFTIGYFSGTPSHENDFRECQGELVEFLKTYPGTRLLVVGFMTFSPEVEKLVEQGNIQRVPLVDFIELQKLIAQVDVNIVPLINNSFTNCKSELKYFEAAVVDTITVATPTYTYRKAIKHGENGYLCNPGQWYHTLEDIYLSKVDCAAVCAAAKQHALVNYSGEEFLKQIEEAYRFFERYEV